MEHAAAVGSVDELAAIRNELLELIHQIPVLVDARLGSRKQLAQLEEKLLLESGRAIRLTVKRGDQLTLNLVVKRDATVKELKRKVREATEERLAHNSTTPSRKICWKHIWKRYWLVHGQTKLADNRKKLNELSIADSSELSFIKQLRRN